MSVRRLVYAAFSLTSAVIVIYFGWVWYSLRAASSPRTVPDRPVSDTRPLTEFRDFPAYWLGMEYDGLPLTFMRINPPIEFGPYVEVALGYGYCRTRGGLDSNSCNPPILIIEQSPCTIDSTLYGRPSDVADGYIWSEGVGISVQTTSASKTSLQQVHRDLKLANDMYFPIAPLVDTTTFRPTILSGCTTTPVSTPVSGPTPSNDR